MRVTPLLNVDAGELPDEPEELYALADLVHVACGGHAGDAESMRHVSEACIRHGTRVGAHPSFEDREHFGRRALHVAPAVLADQVAAQCAQLRTVAEAAGTSLFSVKLHGALYHAASADPAVAKACLDGIERALGPIAVVGLANSALARLCAERGRTFLREAFADRGTRADGSLVPRGEPGALVEDPSVAAANASRYTTQGDVDTLCLHGDTRGAVTIARAVRAALGPKP